MLPMMTAAVTLFYFSAVPIHIAFRLRIGKDSFFGFGISVFEPRFALRQSCKKRKFFHKPPSSHRKPSRLGLLKSILKHVRIEQIRLDGSIGVCDAALTALLCGSASALACAFCGKNGRSARVSLQPDFAANTLHADLSGMIRVRAGHIMLATLLGAFQYGSRRIQKWTSIPSKAS